MKGMESVGSGRGFVSVAALILMLACLGVVLAMLSRSSQGQLMASRFKQGSQAYHNSDEAVEAVFQRFRAIDNNSDAESLKKKIPENIPANEFCSGDVTCFNASGEIKEPASVRLSDVTEVRVRDSSASTARAIRAPVLQRIGFSGSLKDPRSPTDAGESNNTSHVVLEWSGVPSNAGEIEIRRASSSDAGSKDPILRSRGINTKPSVARALLADPSVDWEFVARVDAGSTKYVDKTSSDFKAGTILVYAVKATNKNPLNLDSAYADPKAIEINDGTPSGDAAVKDIIGKAVSTEIVGGVGGGSEWCKTEISGSCLSAQPAFAVAYDGWDGKGDGKPGGIDDKGVFQGSSRYTCNEKRGCYRCPNDQTTGSYQWKWMWSSWDWTGSGCKERCPSTAIQCFYGGSRQCIESGAAFGQRAQEAGCFSTDSRRTKAVPVDGSKNVTSDPGAAVGYCYIHDKDKSPLPDDDSFARGCAGEGRIKAAGGSIAERCDAPGTEKPYSSYSPSPHPGVVDIRSCTTCEAKKGSDWHFAASSSCLASASHDKCYQDCSKTSVPACSTGWRTDVPGSCTPKACDGNVVQPPVCTQSCAGVAVPTCPAGWKTTTAGRCVENRGGAYTIVPPVCTQSCAGAAIPSCSSGWKTTAAGTCTERTGTTYLINPPVCTQSCSGAGIPSCPSGWKTESSGSCTERTGTTYSVSSPVCTQTCSGFNAYCSSQPTASTGQCRERYGTSRLETAPSCTSCSALHGSGSWVYSASCSQPDACRQSCSGYADFDCSSLESTPYGQALRKAYKNGYWSMASSGCRENACGSASVGPTQCNYYGGAGVLRGSSSGWGYWR
jgi:hypothetical protein